MAKTFTYTVQSTPQKLLAEAKDKLKRYQDIKLSGDEQSGRIDGRGFKVEYRMSATSSETTVSIIVDKKPWAIPWGIIKSSIDSEADKW